MFEGVDHRLREEHSARLFVDGGRDDVGVDCQPLLIVAWPLHFHFHRGVLSGQEGSQVFIEDEHHLDLSCIWTEGGGGHEGEANDRERMWEQEQKEKEAGFIYEKGDIDKGGGTGGRKKSRYRNGGIIW